MGWMASQEETGERVALCAVHHERTQQEDGHVQARKRALTGRALEAPDSCIFPPPEL